MSVREVFIPTIGSTLPENGAVVIAIKQTAISTWVVLAIANPGTPRAEYVTWLLDDRGLAYSGRYTFDLIDAVTDYNERA